ILQRSFEFLPSLSARHHNASARIRMGRHVQTLPRGASPHVVAHRPRLCFPLSHPPRDRHTSARHANTSPFLLPHNGALLLLVPRARLPHPHRLLPLLGLLGLALLHHRPATRLWWVLALSSFSRHATPPHSPLSPFSSTNWVSWVCWVWPSSIIVQQLGSGGFFSPVSPFLHTPPFLPSPGSAGSGPPPSPRSNSAQVGVQPSLSPSSPFLLYRPLPPSSHLPFPPISPVFLSPGPAGSGPPPSPRSNSVQHGSGSLLFPLPPPLAPFLSSSGSAGSGTPPSPHSSSAQVRPSFPSPASYLKQAPSPLPLFFLPHRLLFSLLLPSGPPLSSRSSLVTLESTQKSLCVISQQLGSATCFVFPLPLPSCSPPPPLHPPPRCMLSSTPFSVPTPPSACFAPPRPSTPLHAPPRPSTPLHAPPRPSTPLHAPPRPCIPSSLTPSLLPIAYPSFLPSMLLVSSPPTSGSCLACLLVPTLPFSSSLSPLPSPPYTLVFPPPPSPPLNTIIFPVAHPHRPSFPHSLPYAFHNPTLRFPPPPLLPVLSLAVSHHTPRVSPSFAAGFSPPCSPFL
ncbi:unnamed protein product, partial [Closterium sp. NIES-53]